MNYLPQPLICCPSYNYQLLLYSGWFDSARELAILTRIIRVALKILWSVGTVQGEQGTDYFSFCLQVTGLSSAATAPTVPLRRGTWRPTSCVSIACLLTTASILTGGSSAPELTRRLLGILKSQQLSRQGALQSSQRRAAGPRRSATETATLYIAIVSDTVLILCIWY